MLIYLQKQTKRYILSKKTTLRGFYTMKDCHTSQDTQNDRLHNRVKSFTAKTVYYPFMNVVNIAFPAICKKGGTP